MTDQSAAPLIVRLFGEFDAQVHGVPLPKLRSRKEKWLLALLALEAGRPVSRARLAQTLWPFPDHSADLAAYNLRRSLTILRKALGSEADRLRSPSLQTLQLEPAGAEIDVMEFDLACSLADVASSERAIGIYRGALLVECTEEWAAAERARREQMYLKALETLSAAATTAGDHGTAIGYLKQAVVVDPLRERAQRALMEALSKGGDINAALQVYQQLSCALHRERHGVPDAETTALFQALRMEARGRARREPSSSVAPFAAAPRRLPMPLTSLVGREAQVGGIEARLRMVRLLTLTGSGGVGKTRLAVEVANAVADDYPDGAWFVDLSSLSDPALVPQTVAAVLDVREEAGRSLSQTLVEALHARRLLLVLDGCEHLVAAVAQMAEALLLGSRHLQIVATTRQPLGIGGEALWRVPSLSLPDPRRSPHEDRDLPTFLLDYSAIRLFVERAMLAQPDFELTSFNARSVAHVCHRLDGIPLAIELAAARVAALPVEEIARRIHQIFRLLTGGPRTALTRQQTMEATIQWSYDLLCERERSLFRRLSVFAGGWTLEAAEAICAGRTPESGAGPTGGTDMPPGYSCVMRPAQVERGRPPASRSPLSRRAGGEREEEDATLRSARIEEWELLDLLTQLVDRSLVLYEEQNGRARYRFLETARQYSRDRLAETEEVEAIAVRHLQVFLAMAEEAAPTLFGPRAEAWLACLESEHDNLRAALEWAAADDRDLESALRLAAALWRFWHRRSYITEGRAWLDSLLARTACLGGTSVRARACNGAAFLASHQGDVEAARRLFDESRATARSWGTPGSSPMPCIARVTWHGTGGIRRSPVTAIRERRRFGETSAIGRGWRTRSTILELSRAISGTRMQPAATSPRAWRSGGIWTIRLWLRMLSTDRRTSRSTRATTRPRGCSTKRCWRSVMLRMTGPESRRQFTDLAACSTRRVIWSAPAPDSRRAWTLVGAWRISSW